jgi:hypothetical protein
MAAQEHKFDFERLILRDYCEAFLSDFEGRPKGVLSVKHFHQIDCEVGVIWLQLECADQCINCFSVLSPQNQRLRQIIVSFREMRIEFDSAAIASS